jgi:hypothetical protein
MRRAFGFDVLACPRCGGAIPLLWKSSNIAYRLQGASYEDEERRPTHEDESRLHHAAHGQCFVANSGKTAVTVQGV